MIEKQAIDSIKYEIPEISIFDKTVDVPIRHGGKTLIATIKILPRFEEHEYWRANDKATNKDRIVREKAERENTEPPYTGDLMREYEENLMSRAVPNVSGDIVIEKPYSKNLPGAIVRLLFREIIPKIHQWPTIPMIIPFETTTSLRRPEPTPEPAAEAEQ